MPLIISNACKLYKVFSRPSYGEDLHLLTVPIAYLQRIGRLIDIFSPKV